MLLLTNDKHALIGLGLAPLLKKLTCVVRYGAADAFPPFMELVARSSLEPRLLFFRIDPASYLDTVDWVSEHWQQLEKNHLAVLAMIPEVNGAAQGRAVVAREVIVFTNNGQGQAKVEHIDPANIERTLEILLTIHYDFLLDEFGEHEYPGLNDKVDTGGHGYNIQTQYYPGDKARISSEIYMDGRIIKTFTHFVKGTKHRRRKLLFLIEDLHTKILSNIEALGGA
jgi:hypothetical protein